MEANGPVAAVDYGLTYFAEDVDAVVVVAVVAASFVGADVAAVGRASGP